MERIIMPKQGLQMTEGVITRWLAAEGDKVVKGEPLFEMETDKLTITIDSTATGTLLKILRPEGDTVPITQTIAYVGNPGEKAPGDEAQSSKEGSRAKTDEEKVIVDDATIVYGAKAASESSSASERIFASPRAKTRAEELKIDIKSLTPSGPDGLIIERDVISARSRLASPLARKEALLSGQNIDDISGTGIRGKVMARDVRAAAEQDAKQSAACAPVPEKRLPLKGMRRIIAERMKKSLNDMAQANHVITVDMTEATRVREQLKAADVKVSFNDIIIRCVAAALSETPMMNASIEGDEIVLKSEINVGMAVATQTGLLVPVIRNADKTGLCGISKKANDLSARARENRLTPDELTGGTFTVTNL
ncbi:MAG: dihydrolipoamide acetyltransferase family protein, partial [Clostridia bacterium]|nr:dihydrolipoamide acetyltransferase family protein [Clostridia bacterium]